MFDYKIKKSILFTIICYLFIITNNFAVHSHSDKKLLKKAEYIENKILSIYDHLIKSTVCLPLGGSGVLVSKDGYILTAGHIFSKAGLEIKVQLYDGKKYTAITLGKDERGDYGLLKIKGQGSWEYTELGSSKELKEDEACLMFGFPGKYQAGRHAIIRIGFVINENSDGFLQTTCIMMPGDSGGPLFNMEGKLIGINSRIYKNISKNCFAPVDKIKKNWERLVKGEFFNKGENNNYASSWGHQASSSKEKNKTSAHHPFVLAKGKDGLIEVLNAYGKQISKSVVDISSCLDGITTDVYGSIVDSKGFIISKSSRVGNTEINCKLHNGEKISASVVGRNKANDLVLLQIKTKTRLYPIKIKKKANIQLGQLLGSVNTKEVMYSGILGVEAKKIKYIKPREHGLIGLKLYKGEFSIIKKVNQGEAAEKAGLQKDDKIIKIDTSSVRRKKDLIAYLKQTDAGETIKVKIIRNNKEKEVELQLGKSSLKTTSAENNLIYSVDVNERSDGFQTVFKHDMPLYINECGTPVINLKGEVIGINIARTDRTASYAIPISKVAEVIQEISEEYGN
jgi:serine protease Do